MGWAGLFTQGGFFIFLFFISVFYKNIFSIWKFTEIYPGRPAAGRPGPGRPAVGRQGLIRKKKRRKKLQTGPWGRSPGCGAAGPPGRPAAGRPAPHPYIRCWLPPHPLICLTKNLEKKKREGGRERQSGEALSDFQAMFFIVQVPSSTNALGLYFVIVALFTKLYCKPKTYDS